MAFASRESETRVSEVSAEVGKMPDCCPGAHQVDAADILQDLASFDAGCGVEPASTRVSEEKAAKGVKRTTRLP